MTQCAGCGKRIVPDEPKVTMNKVWHKMCFKCNKCNCNLNADFARVYNGEIYCHSCFKIFRRYCSFVGEDEAATIEEHREMTTSSSQKMSPMNSEDFLCKNKRQVDKGGGHAIPRELANYFNRNPVGDKKTSPPVCPKDQNKPCACQLSQTRPKSRSGMKKRKNTPCSVSRSSSCLNRAARSLSKRRKDSSDSSESLQKCSRQPRDTGRNSGEPKLGGQKKTDREVKSRHKYTGCEPCRRCGHKVYAAEIVLSSYGAYHNSCFSCYSCLKPLDATNVEEHCGEIFCRRCYKKHFGFNNYGFRNRL